MAERGDTHYPVKSLNRWFLFSSAFFLISLVWLMLSDWDRPWKNYQREFREIELERAEAERARLESEEAATEAQLAQARDAAEATVASHQSRLDELSEELRLARGALWSVTEVAKRDKADYDWTRYLIEEERIHVGDPTLKADELEAAEARMNASIDLREKAQAEFDEIDQRVTALTEVRDKAVKALAAGTRELELARKRVEQLDPSDAPTKIANVIRDAPGLDFVGPSLKPQKVVLSDLTFELNFTKKKRIDMCHTCHLAIDRAGFEDEPQPFTTHPRLDLYLTAKSPHALNDVGCSICHRGSGEALDFVRADHRPDVQGFADITENDSAIEEWKDEHHWHKQHHWDYPMLPASMTEASCVQCHKTSMELIADAAPTVTEGYRNFERYGCYSCHKVDWFEAKRKPGPSLKNFQAKTTQDFAASWIADPQGFRPTTWMPQIFHLENFAPDQVIATSEYGHGPEILGQQWNDTAIASIVSFLSDRAPEQPLPPIPVTGDATRGSEVFRLSGCLACHNMAPAGEDENLPRDMALMARGTNEHGPNLRGVATKVDATWLYNWIKDPASYWSGTRMPNLRLSDQDAADVVAYMMEDPDGYFTDTPEGWAAEPSPLDVAALQEMARWFFAREGRSTVEARLKGEDPEHAWNDPAQLSVVIGERLVTHYGCYSCHEISGMETMMPIGTELTNWASKTVDKLDFALMKHLMAEEYGWSEAQEKQFEEYKEGWLMQKLHAPRSYDRDKVKNPLERLRMPWFDFDEREVFTIATFVAGLVDDEVQLAKMVPTSEQAAVDAGARVVRQDNCMACHMIEPGTVTFEDGDGMERTVRAELLAIGDAAVPPAHDVASLTDELEYWEESEVGLRLLEVVPGLGDIGERVFVDGIERIQGMTPPRGGDFVRLVTDYYFNGAEIFDAQAEDPDEAFYSVTGDPDGELRVQDVDGVWRSFAEEQYDKVRWTYAPPVLWDEGGKIHKDWFYSFLNDVQPIRPQIRVRMPSFHFNAGEAASVADYFAYRSAQEWPRHYTREMLHAKDVTPEDVAAATSVLAADVQAICEGDRIAARTGFSEVLRYASEHDFSWWGPVDPAYEAVMRRTAAYRESQPANQWALGEKLAVEKVNCFQCHFRLGQAPPADPIAWAPDIASVEARLREDWTQRWIEDPSRVYPGTSMPQNFSDASAYHDVYPGSTNGEQIEAVLDYLYNFDRITIRSQN